MLYFYSSKRALTYTTYRKGNSSNWLYSTKVWRSTQDIQCICMGSTLLLWLWTSTF